jgi:hypothetical protein
MANQNGDRRRGQKKKKNQRKKKGKRDPLKIIY